MLLQFLIISFLFVGILAAGNPDKVVVLKRTDTNITIDGIIESAWSRADSAADFFQAQPYFGKEPSRKTVAKLLTSEEALYCLVICYDDYRNIEQKKGKLDDGGGNENPL